jgi:hypothetical protein
MASEESVEAQKQEVEHSKEAAEAQKESTQITRGESRTKQQDDFSML